MKYLIQHKKEFAISVAAFIMAVINLYKAIRSHDISEDLIVAVLVTATTVLAWYYNMPTSEENTKHTGLMRLEKASKKDGYIGENFFDDMDDEEEDDDFFEQCEEQPEDANDKEVIDE